MGQFFKSEFSILFLILALVLSAVISIYYYRNSQISSPKSYLFITLRALSIFLILLLFASPVISYVIDIDRTPVNVFLIDNSESLTIENRDSILKKETADKFTGLSTHGDNYYFTFSDDILNEITSDEIEEVGYSGINNFETDLSQTFLSLESRFVNKNLSSVNIISDGIITSGGNPLSAALQLNVPVNYILTGDTIQKNDLLVRNVFFNKTAFIESSVPVKAEIQSFGYNVNIKVNLYEEGKLIISKNISVVNSVNVYSVDFDIISSTEGIKRYKIEVEEKAGEITNKNNSAEFLIKFIDNKFKVLALAGSPSPDFAFISSELKKVKNFETDLRTQKNANEFYEGAYPDPGAYDAVIFIGYPTSVSNTAFLENLREAIVKNKSSLFFFASRNTDYSKLSLFGDILPFTASDVSATEIETGVNFVSKPSFGDTVVFKNSSLLEPINSFPNIFINQGSFIPKSSSETYIISTVNSSPVFLISSNSDGSGSAAFLAHGIYKWRLNKFNLNAESVLNNIITSALLQITDKERRKLFNIETTKQVYSKLEDVIFKAWIKNYEITGGEKIKVNIFNNNFGQEIFLTKKGNNYYEGSLRINENGDYSYSAELLQDENQVATELGRFIIGENNEEYKITKADNSVLSLLKNETGGRNFSGESKVEIENFLNELNRNSEERYSAMRNDPLNVNPYYLSLLILFLCTEWFLRKRNNLP